MCEYYILTGKIGSGKTTFITNWLKEVDNTAGIITITKDGKRVLRDVAGNEERRFEVDDSFEGPVLKVGQFIFDETAFTWVADKIDDITNEDCFILDEAGLLELNKKGFYNAIIKLLRVTKEKDIKLVFVVREQCVDAFMELFELKNVKICNKENFNSLIKFFHL